MNRERHAWLIDGWQQCSQPASALRRNVFGLEMGIDESIDLDAEDAAAIHAVLFLDGNPIATGRLCVSARRIGRMAVARAHRGQGHGARLLGRLLREAVRAGIPEVILHAQEQAAGFYAHLGFSTAGPAFFEAGIRHLPMTHRLSWRPAVAGVLVRGERILLGRRAPQLTKGNHWDLFGGKIEPGESESAALIREFHEELSIRIEPSRLLRVILYEDNRDRGLWRCPVYRITQWTGDIILNEEHLESRWLSIDDMQSLRLTHRRLPELAKLAIMEGQ